MDVPFCCGPGALGTLEASCASLLRPNMRVPCATSRATDNRHPCWCCAPDFSHVVQFQYGMRKYERAV